MKKLKLMPIMIEAIYTQNWVKQIKSYRISENLL